MSTRMGLRISNAENEKKIANAGCISLFALKITVGIFFGLAVLTVVGRMVTRVYTRRRLFLDDAFLIFGLICLCAATTLSYMFARTMFVKEAMQRYPNVVIPPDQYKPLESAMAVGVSFLCLTWTTMYAVKFSFLALFWNMVQKMSKCLSRYYWGVVATCVISWMFMICEPFILCRYFGREAVKCFTNVPYRLNAALKGLITALDIITDIMIVTIPIIILGQTQLRTSQKVSLGAFLCLSVAMMGIASTRLSGIRNNNTVWLYYWQLVEACVACIMVSLFTFRTLFVGGRARVFKQHELGGQLPSISQRIRHQMKRFNVSAWEEVGNDQPKLPEIPSASFSGLWTFIGRNHRSPGHTAAISTDLDQMDDGNPPKAWSSYPSPGGGEMSSDSSYDVISQVESQTRAS